MPVGRVATCAVLRLVYQRLTKDVEVSAHWPLAFETGLWEGHQGHGSRTDGDWRTLFGAVGEAERPMADSLGGLRRADLPRRRLRISRGAVGSRQAG